MFDSFSMQYSYKDRKIKNTKINNAVIDTCSVTDSDQPYETGIQHPSYNDNSWIIVEMYTSKKKAIAGHNKWVKIFEKNKLPSQLKDASTSTTCKMLVDFVGKRQSYKKKK